MICNLLNGGSVRDCECRLPDKGGWLECPAYSPSAAELNLIRRVALGQFADWEITPKGARMLADSGSKAAAGFTGDICQTCGSPRMIRTGTCLTCQDCGDTSGGCS